MATSTSPDATTCASGKVDLNKYGLSLTKFSRLALALSSPQTLANCANAAARTHDPTWPAHLSLITSSHVLGACASVTFPVFQSSTYTEAVDRKSTRLNSSH